ncbi:MAG: aminoacyl-tRNA hydrolase [Paracoccaceae bacterium]|nr:aminoacyl-tRNA hydrolase [Paracoccaceae bacterium]
MQIFVGLGNPGAKHARQRHNIGFMVLDRIAEEHGFGPWRAKFQGEIAEGRFGSERVMLLKPQTYMNLSGQSVGEAMRYLKAEPGQIWVFHDELDLAPGKVRVKSGGGHAGHNGLRSLHQHIGEGYHRVRMGIGHPGHKDRVSGYVLHDFAKADQDWLDPLLDAVARAAGQLAQGDASSFMNAVALATRPERSDAPITEMKPRTKSVKAETEPPADPQKPRKFDDILANLLAKFSRNG